MVINIKKLERKNNSPFIVLEETFDDEFFNKLNEEIITSKNGRRVMGGRYNIHFDPNTFKKNEFPAWNQFYEFLCSFDLKKHLQKKYERELNFWKAGIDFFDSDLKIVLYWANSEDGYWREPHFDSNGRLWSFIVFFNDKQWDGGDLVLHKSSNVFFHVRNYFFKKLPILKTIKAKSNSGVFWLSSPDSYHSVTLQKNTRESRKFIYGSICSNNYKWLEKHEVFRRQVSPKLNVIFLITDIFSFIYMKIKRRFFNSNGEVYSRTLNKVIKTIKRFSIK